MLQELSAENVGSIHLDYDGIKFVVFRQHCDEPLGSRPKDFNQLDNY
jgi:hypothetical protein